MKGPCLNKKIVKHKHCYIANITLKNKIYALRK